MHRKKMAVVFLVPFVALIGLLAARGSTQGMSNYEHDLVKDMLRQIAADIRKHYYDPKFHGLDWDAKVQETMHKIDQSQEMNMALAHVAAALDAFDDSHTFFFPPPRPYRDDYGWQWQMIGDRCYVIRVHPQSDAETKGLKPGEEVLAINGYAPDRSNFWKMEYVFNTLRPQSGLRVSLRDLAGSQRKVDVAAKVTELKRTFVPWFDVWESVRAAENEHEWLRGRTVEVSDELMIHKLPRFLLSDADVNGIITKARKHKALILDLRGNTGGAVDSLQLLVGSMFGHDVKIGDRVGREAKTPMVAKARHDPFTGKLVVIVDSISASGAELFARVVQIEKRGLVIGDRSSGKVMEARHYNYRGGTSVAPVVFGASITDADTIMTDGKSLEHAGVVPDEVVLPTATDLASGRDPVLARAAEMLGVKLTPEEAGKMFPYQWPK